MGPLPGPPLEGEGDVSPVFTDFSDVSIVL